MLNAHQRRPPGRRAVAENPFGGGTDGLALAASPRTLGTSVLQRRAQVPPAVVAAAGPADQHASKLVGQGTVVGVRIVSTQAQRAEPLAEAATAAHGARELAAGAPATSTRVRCLRFHANNGRRI